MRILFATTRGAGHLGPLVPFAHACVAAGHEVRVAAAPSVEHHVRRSGLPFAPLDEPDEAIMAAAVGDGAAPRRRSEQARIVFQEVFAGEFARSALPRMLEIARRWRPDVIVRETSEFASVLAADDDRRADRARRVLPRRASAIASSTSTRRWAACGRASGCRATSRSSRSRRARSSTPTTPRPRACAGSARRGCRRGRCRTGGTAPPAPLVYVSFGSSAAGNGFFPDVYREAADGAGRAARCACC